MEDFGSPILRQLLDALPDAVLETHAQHGDLTARVAREQLVEVMRLLRDGPELEFDLLSDLCGVDYLGQEPRFEVVYHLYSIPRNHRLRVKVRMPEADPELPSLHTLWPAANWMEREAFDFYGIRFSGHPNLKRILLYEGFEGHPLRKDYPKERRQPLVGPRN